jgi:hypothetical protein
MPSSLARFAHLWGEEHDEHARKLAREAFHNHGIILLRPGWLPGWADRKQAEQLAEKVHGKRRS